MQFASGAIVTLLVGLGGTTAAPMAMVVTVFSLAALVTFVIHSCPRPIRAREEARIHE